MKRIAAILVPALLIAAPLARADAYDNFPFNTAEPAAAAEAAQLNLCEHHAVREVARIDRSLAPLKEAVGIATNPTGFALKMVDRHVVHIPRWVGIAMDPKGYVKGQVIDRARAELKKAVGLGKDCREEIEAQAA
jgi:hypothetical protein